MNHYVLRKKVRQELDEIWEYIARDDADAADRWIYKLRDSFRMLAENPRVGHTRKDLTDKKVRFWPVGKYIIIYRIQADDILIVAITQGARDIPSYPTFAAAPEPCSLVTQH